MHATIAKEIGNCKEGPASHKCSVKGHKWDRAECKKEEPKENDKVDMETETIMAEKDTETAKDKGKVTETKKVYI